MFLFQEVNEGEEVVGLVNQGTKLGFIYSAKHNYSSALIEANNFLLFSSESNRRDDLRGPSLNYIQGTNYIQETNPCIDGSHTDPNDSFVASGNMVFQSTNGLPFVDMKSYWNTCEKLPTTVYDLEILSDIAPLDSRLLLERCLAAIAADDLIFCLVPTSQAHEKVISSPLHPLEILHRFID